MADDFEPDDLLGLDAPQGGLSQAAPDVSGAVESFRQRNMSGQPDPLDIMWGRVQGLLPDPATYQKAQAQRQQALQNLSGAPWMRFAAGMLKPTHTGSFGESFGQGLEGYASGQELYNKAALESGQQDITNANSLEKFGMDSARIGSTLKAIQARMQRPSPEAIKALSRVAARGLDINTPQGAQAYKDEMAKMEFLAGVTPDIRTHLMTLNPDNMGPEQLRAAAADRQKTLDTMQQSKFLQQTSPLHSYGVDDATIFDNLEGDALKEAMPPALKSTVESLLNGNITVSDLRARNSTAAPQILGLATRIDPQFSTARNKMVNDYKSAKQGSTGANMVAINTAIGHAGTMYELAQAMKNGNLQAVNSIVNTVKTWTGNENVTDANLALHAIANELEKALRGANTSESGIKEYQGQINAKSFSPEQIQGALNTVTKLLASRMENVNEPWKREFHNDYPVLTEKSKKVLEQIQAKHGVKNDWLDRAAKANPKMSREDLISEGKKRGKLASDYHE